VDNYLAGRILIPISYNFNYNERNKYFLFN
jgi:hypothetical protein